MLCVVVSLYWGCGTEEVAGPADGGTLVQWATLTLTSQQPVVAADGHLKVDLAIELTRAGGVADLYVSIAGDTPRFLTHGSAASFTAQPEPLAAAIAIDAATTLPVFDGPATGFPAGTPFALEAILVARGRDYADSPFVSDRASIQLGVTGEAPDDEAAQLTVVSQLRALAGDRFVLEADNRVVERLRLDLPAADVLELTDATDPDETAIAFMRTYGDLLRVKDAGRRLRISARESDGDQAITFFRQYVRDIPVFGSWLQLIMRSTANGVTIEELRGNYVPDLELANLVQVIDGSAAVRRLAAHYGVDDTKLKQLLPPRLWVYDEGLFAPQCPSCAPRQSNPRLAWRITHYSIVDMGDADAFIDAQTGELLHMETRAFARDYRIFTARHNGPDSCFLANSGCHAWFDEGGRCRYEVGCPLLADCCGNLCAWAAWRCADPSTEGYDLFDHTNDVYDFFRDVYGRDSYDDGDKILRMYAHAGNRWENARSKQCGAYRVHIFGDGMATLNIVAHEVGHSYHDHETDFVYRNESGAVAEHIADAIGHLVGVWSGRDPDWDHGEHSAGNTRSMSDPPSTTTSGGTPYPDEYAEYDDRGGGDHGGVHFNHMILSKAMYLFTDGDTFDPDDLLVGGPVVVEGIGEEKSRQILKRTVNNVLGDNPSFRRFADGMIGSCDAYARSGSYGVTDHDCCQVRKAYAAVGVVDLDTDCDGIVDTADSDIDGDGITNRSDNCHLVPNPSQSDTDADGIGNACDDDWDNDTVPNADDNCPHRANPGQANRDGDEDGDACDDTDHDGIRDDTDNCVTNPNRDQTDSDGDGRGDVCDNNDDNDDFDDDSDNCPLVANNDQANADGDYHGDACDNCPDVYNDQSDLDADGLGDACDDDIDNDTIPNSEDHCPETYTHVSEWLICPPQSYCEWGCPPRRLIDGSRLRFSDDLAGMDPSVLAPMVVFEADPCGVFDCDPGKLLPRGDDVFVKLDLNLYSQGVELNEPVAVEVAVLDEAGRAVASGQAGFVVDGNAPAAQTVEMQFTPNPAYAWGQSTDNNPPLDGRPAYYISISTTSTEAAGLQLMQDMGLYVDSEVWAAPRQRP